ncbi:NTP pyrophosphohydrolase [Herbiconiux sp. KACC 21604]|uniref:NTP pyrophosphohydrolase n=1 Tax=unclassified Herbiconiux TaxID=2618217 RepID=UPI001491E717|nr:NTP pyrophosphohydrolase [Herbiconiux sp. SALV-R1]QJU55191.1 NTP pyrophosphohydrolase [Herbiconiux sp. SALV-R1]WPO86355.1 NTP pyrophosphohydrolase [Herbiconiux sp. KACC 21604]
MSTSLLVAAPTSAPAGRISVRDRVIEKIVHRASADAIGVESGEVKVEVSEWRGGYAVRVRTPLPIPDLDDTEAIAAGSSVIDRVTAVQQQLQSHLAHVTGRDITRLAVVVTGAVVPPRRRVR